MEKDYTKVKLEAQKKYPDFVDAVASLGVTELEARILSYAKELDNVDEALKSSPEINAHKEALKKLKGPYSDTIKAIKLKIKYLLSQIDEKGGDVSGTGESEN